MIRQSGGRDAPQLPVLYRCQKCGVGAVLDAYDGPPSCAGTRDGLEYHGFMKALSIQDVNTLGMIIEEGEYRELGTRVEQGDEGSPGTIPDDGR